MCFFGDILSWFLEAWQLNQFTMPATYLFILPSVQRSGVYGVLLPLSHLGEHTDRFVSQYSAFTYTDVNSTAAGGIIDSGSETIQGQTLTY